MVPDAGCGIGEADYAQIEVGVAAAVYGDANLVRMFNAGDVYSAMAAAFFAAELPPGDRTLDPAEFKARHPDLRARMKVCTLGVIYGLGSRSLAARLNVPEARAKDFTARFFALFPALHRALEDGPRNAELRGCVADVSGLRRHRVGAGPMSSWEKNWVRNHPVQGAAAAVFKDAGNALDRVYGGCGARLIVPLHDAFVFEAPLGDLGAVAAATERVMIDAVRVWFPELQPRVAVNVSHPWCWNKDGRADSVDRWVEDPLFTL